mmetsp:Transcript_30654/g.42445  ORF Transcript_30654/g.42445 Transcript_30654/m.42445 type:complete len:129 (+) Transcript_30654:228-614(+)
MKAGMQSLSSASVITNSYIKRLGMRKSDKLFQQEISSQDVVEIVESREVPERFPGVPDSPNSLKMPAQISLFAPGILFHARRDEGTVRIIEGVHGVCFDRICLSKSMLKDHLLDSYIAALKSKIEVVS